MLLNGNHKQVFVLILSLCFISCLSFHIEKDDKFNNFKFITDSFGMTVAAIAETSSKYDEVCQAAVDSSDGDLVVKSLHYEFDAKGRLVLFSHYYINGKHDDTFFEYSENSAKTIFKRSDGTVYITTYHLINDVLISLSQYRNNQLIVSGNVRKINDNEIAEYWDGNVELWKLKYSQGKLCSKYVDGEDNLYEVKYNAENKIAGYTKIISKYKSVEIVEFQYQTDDTVVVLFKNDDGMIVGKNSIFSIK